VRRRVAPGWSSAPRGHALRPEQGSRPAAHSVLLVANLKTHPADPKPSDESARAGHPIVAITIAQSAGVSSVQAIARAMHAFPREAACCSARMTACWFALPESWG
jgi:hypothetical protein